MMTPEECAKAWKTVVQIYKDTRETNPKATIQKIVDTIGLDAAVDVFAVVVYIKKHDGRISEKNKHFMNKIIFNTECVKMKNGNPMLYAGLDAIHPAHINQLVTELIAKIGKEIRNGNDRKTS